MNRIISKLKVIFIAYPGNNFKPKLLDNNFIYYLIIVLFILKIFNIIFLINLPNTTFYADITRTALVNFINQERISSGLCPLEENEQLNTGAYLKAKDMIEKDYFSHQSPEGINPWYWFSLAGYKYKYAGENLAIGFIDSEQVFKGWINSESHKKNILNPNYQEIGIAVLNGDFQGRETTIVVKFLGSSLGIKPVEEINLNQKQEINLEPEIKDKSLEKQDLVTVQGNTDKNDEDKTGIVLALQDSEKIQKDFVSFLYFDYERLLQKITFGLIFLIIACLVFNFLINYDFLQKKDLILRSAILIIILLASSYINKDFLMNGLIENLI